MRRVRLPTPLTESAGTSFPFDFADTFPRQGLGMRLVKQALIGAASGDAMGPNGGPVRECRLVRKRADHA